MRSDLFKAANQLNNNVESKVLMNAFQAVDNARGIRLAYVSFDVHPLRMAGILLLAVLVQIAVTFGYASKPKALVVTMSIATATVLTPICMLALTFTSPYLGVIAIGARPGIELLDMKWKQIRFMMNPISTVTDQLDEDGEVIEVSYTRFYRHFVKVLNGTGGVKWSNAGSFPRSSSWKQSIWCWAGVYPLPKLLGI